MEYEIKGEYGAVSWDEKDILRAHERAICEPEQIHSGSVDFCRDVCPQERPQRDLCQNSED